jgi:putative methionine-R-sulfoxide reductase with GAF domain
MEIDVDEFSSLLGVVEYSDLDTSLTELMEKTCRTLQRLLADKKGLGNWTWSVFVIQNTSIEQKAVGGVNANFRKTVTKRKVKTGMIATVINTDEQDVIYAPDVKELEKQEGKFYRILQSTESAIVARIERNNDVVGAINIESDRKDDFDLEIVSNIFGYVAKIISPILTINDFRSLISKYDNMFSRTLHVLENHEKNSLQVFFKDIIDLFYLEFRLDACILFMGIDNNNFRLVTHSRFDNYSSSCEPGTSIESVTSLLNRTIKARTDSPLSTSNITLEDLLGKNEISKGSLLEIDYARLYKLRVQPEHQYVLVAISNNQFNPPEIISAKRYEGLMQSSLHSYLALEKERLNKLEKVLAGDLYKAAILEESHSNFLEIATNKISETLKAEACLILFVRLIKNTEEQSKFSSTKLELVSSAHSSYSENIVDEEQVINILNQSSPEKSEFKYKKVEANAIGSSRINNIDIFMDDLEPGESQSDIKILLCLVNENLLPDKSYEELVENNISILLGYIANEINQCMQLINNSINNTDTKSGFEIIQRYSQNIEKATSFEELVQTLHKMFGKTYESGVEDSFLNSVNMLKGCNFSVFTLNDNDLISLTTLSKSIGELPPDSPSFKRGEGLTGKVIDSENGEIWVARVENTSNADLNCRSYWNKVLSTQFRYFYGKKIVFGNTIGVITLIGPRMPYFQEQVFSNTIKNIIGVLSDNISASGMKFKEELENTEYKEITRKILQYKGPRQKNVFLMIRFIKQDKYRLLRIKIEGILKKHGLNMLVADEHAYDEHLNVNLEAYMNACNYCIAILDGKSMNPNIAFELGFMRRAGAGCLLLKDIRLKELNADFLQKIWKEVDIENVDSISPIIETWIKRLKP